MLSVNSVRALRASKLLRSASIPRYARTYSSADTYNSENPVPASSPNPPQHTSPVSKTNEQPTSAAGNQDGTLQENVKDGEYLRVMQSPDRQSPNRKGIWSPSQMPRAKAMVGPRFEQTIMADQPRPYSAIDLIHKHPVRFINERIASCDGGGGPLGHPRIFINVDKPQICPCEYCGTPYAHEHHRAYLESLPETSYPLGPKNEKTSNY